MKKFSQSKQDIIFLMLLMMLALIVRVYLAVNLGYASIKGDELVHWGLSKSIFENGQTNIRMFPADRFSSLYSIAISWVHIFQGCDLQYTIAKIVNSIYMVSALIPAFLLAKRVLQDRVYVWISLIITALLPEFAYNVRIIQENLSFPMAMWTFYFVYKMYSNEKIKTKDIIVTAAGAFLCYWAKEAGICIAIAILCSLILNMFYEPKAKENIKSVLVYITAFGCIYLLVHGVYLLMNPEMNQIPLVKEALINFNTQYILKWIRGGFHYLIILVMSIGFAVAVLPFVGFYHMEKCDQKTIMCILFTAFWAIVESVCMIYVSESGLRVHIRYLFYVIPIIWIFFIKTSKVLYSKQIKLMGKEKMFLVGCFTVCLVAIIAIGLFPSTGSLIDGNSNRHITNNYLAVAIGTRYYQILLYCMLITFTLGTIILIIKAKYIKLIYIEVIFFCTIQLVNNFLCYHDEYLAKNNFSGAAKEYQAIDTFLNTNISKDRTVALMSRGFAGSTIELHLEWNHLYYIDWDTCLSEINYEDGTLKDNQLVYTYWLGTQKKMPPEIMIVDSWIMERYGFLSYKVIFETENHKVLEKIKDKFELEILADFDIQGNTADGWITNQEAILTMSFKEKVDEISIIYGNSVMPGAVLAIRGENGEETKYNLAEYNGEIRYRVDAEAGDTKTLTIYGAKTCKPSDVGIPDDRELCVIIEDVIF